MNNLTLTLDALKEEIDKSLTSPINTDGTVKMYSSEKCNYFKLFWFLIYAQYSDILNFDISDGHNSNILNEISISISASSNKRKDKILKIWNKVKEGVSAENIRHFCAIINKYELELYNSEENDKVISQWANKKLIQLIDLSDRPIMSFEHGRYDDIFLDIITDCQLQLDINLNKNTLVCAGNESVISYFLNNNITNRSITFYHCVAKFAILINVAFFDCYSNIQCISDSREASGEIFPFDTTFDNVVYTLNHNVNYSKLLNYVKDGGCCIAHVGLNQLVQKHFQGNNQFPLIFDGEQGRMVVCKKNSDGSQIVRYAILSTPDYKDEIKKCIKQHISSDYYQELTKDDFLWSSSPYSFSQVRRDKDQLHFIWKPISEIIKIVEKGEPVYNSDFDINKVIKYRDLSSEPFNTKLPSNFYLYNFINTPNSEVLYNDVKIWNNNMDDIGECNFNCPNVYKNLLLEVARSRENELSPDALDFLKKTCCKILKEPCWLIQSDKFIHVEATESSPVCFLKYAFYMNDDTGVPLLACSEQINTAEFSSQYDVQFVIYQLSKLKNYNQKKILVAPTKEEQHSYYMEKCRSHVATYDSIVDEIDKDVKQRISQAPVYIRNVGFKNFRKFSDLQPLSLGNITFLVGQNNSGKSTLVKGLLLAFDNIRYLNMGGVDNYSNGMELKFRFDTDLCHDLHVGTFKRALNSKATSKMIGFSMSIANFDLVLTIQNNADITDDVTIANIASLQIRDNSSRNCVLNFDFIQRKLSVSFTFAGEEMMTGIDLNALIQAVHLNSIIHLIRRLPDYITDLEFKRKIENSMGFFPILADELAGTIANCKVEYIYAHATSQKILYNYGDKNDYMALTLHEYNSERIGSQSPEHEFVCSWMKKFKLGIDYDIHSLEGEAYTIQIKGSDGRLSYLADAGVGTNQLMIMFLRIATLIHRYSKLTDFPYQPLIIIEEPEQNLHPAFQSLLADFFKEVSDKYGFRFIVETHSEYLIRKTQLLVSREKYSSDEELENKNIFKVYYFPENSIPYPMEYRIDGNFANEFGRGFFDEANSIMVKIFLS